MSWAVQEVPECKLFNKFACKGVEVNDITLKPFINVESTIIVPHTASRLQRQYNGKSRIPITERFCCYMMKKGRNSGKKLLAMRCLEDAFTIVHILTGQNPLQVFVDAIINSGPREDSARIGRGGAMKRTSVDVSPTRRLNIALFLLSRGIRESAMKNVRTFAECIAEELIAAAKASPNSYAVKKRDEIERVAKSNR
ncbi:Ribosomal protein S7 [Trachipleistophora hominis]|uniref:Ribosomal protein S7 n=1 Tax=Trachipleistophora hominis TaxID=72359 RepID=L7JZX6_TRAHO|nr:Ribosomal protein S7 [Trachipleistophora hominis]